MPLQYKDYYKTLGVAKTASEKEIKSAYRKLARQWHPDVNPTRKKESEEKFKEIAEAYEVLGDKDKRARYDALGSDWQHQATRGGGDFRRSPDGFSVEFGDFGDFEGAPGGSQFSDFFNRFFGGHTRTGTGRARTSRGSDVESDIELTLREAYSGVKRAISLQTEGVCPKCHGTGAVDNKLCMQCRGTGSVATVRTLDVTIPAGVRDGQRIRLSGQGAPGSGGSGDLFLRVRLVPDSTFKRVGDDLEIERPVDVYTLVLGGEIAVPTMTGTLDMKVPAGSQNGRRLRVAGKGMPKRGGGYGDLYVKLVAEVPTSLTARERELFEQLSAEAKKR